MTASSRPTDSTAPAASSAQPATNDIGVIGLGNMGLPMTRRLLAAGHRVGVTARTAERAAAAVAAGAAWSPSPRDLVDHCPVLLLMVPDLPQVEEVLFREDGIAASDRECLVVVASTVSAGGIRLLDERLRAATDERMRLVDAPVSGGTEGAEAGTLSIMVGGDAAGVARVVPLLRACGTPLHLGPLGAGEVAKACNQLIIAATMTAISEAAVVAERSGLDVEALLELLQGGYAASRVLETKTAMLVSRDYTPGGVAAFMNKDLAFAAAEADATGTATPQLDTLRAVFADLTARGLGDQDLAVVHRYIGESVRGRALPAP